jgi:hypothetical protein
MYSEDDWMAWIGFLWFEITTMSGCCEQGDEPLTSTKFGEFLNKLRDPWTLFHVVICLLHLCSVILMASGG